MKYVDSKTIDLIIKNEQEKTHTKREKKIVKTYVGGEESVVGRGRIQSKEYGKDHLGALRIKPNNSQCEGDGCDRSVNVFAAVVVFADENGGRGADRNGRGGEFERRGVAENGANAGGGR